MSRLSAAERRQQNVGSRASAAARGHGRACRRCDNLLLFPISEVLVVVLVHVAELATFLVASWALIGELLL